MAGSTREAYDVEAIVDVAVRLFLERGYDAASISDLARAAGLTKSAVYHHVASKEELFRRGIQRAINALDAIFDEEAQSVAPAVERLRRVIRRVVEQMMQHLPEVSLLLNARGNSQTERWAITERRNFDNRLEKLLRDGIREGSVRTDLDPELLSRLIFGLTNSIVSWYRPLDAMSEQHIVSTVESLVFSGILQQG